MEITIGVDGELLPGDVILWGEYDRDSDRSGRQPLASSMPRKLLVQLLLVDETGRQLEEFRSFLKFKENGTIKRVKRSFPGFEIEAGQILIARLKPKPATATVDRPLRVGYDYDPDFGAATLAYALRAFASGGYPLRGAAIDPEDNILLDVAFGQRPTSPR